MVPEEAARTERAIGHSANAVEAGQMGTSGAFRHEVATAHRHRALAGGVAGHARLVTQTVAVVTTDLGADLLPGDVRTQHLGISGAVHVGRAARARLTLETGAPEQAETTLEQAPAVQVEVVRLDARFVGRATGPVVSLLALAVEQASVAVVRAAATNTGRPTDVVGIPSDTAVPAARTIAVLLAIVTGAVGIGIALPGGQAMQRSAFIVGTGHDDAGRAFLTAGTDVARLYPAAGGDIGSVVAWEQARRVSRNKHLFGKGSFEGLAASCSAAASAAC